MKKQTFAEMILAAQSSQNESNHSSEASPEVLNIKKPEQTCEKCNFDLSNLGITQPPAVMKNRKLSEQ